MLTPEQLDAAYAAFAAFIGDTPLTPQALAVIQRAFLCGYAAACEATAPAPFPALEAPVPPPATYYQINPHTYRWQPN